MILQLTIGEYHGVWRAGNPHIYVSGKGRSFVFSRKCKSPTLAAKLIERYILRLEANAYTATELYRKEISIPN